MAAALSKINQQLKRPETKDGLYQTYLERVRDYFHVILCMSPVGDLLRVRCRNFPSLITCCTLDWFDNWPAEALLNVARRLLPSNLADMFPPAHRSVESAAQSFYDEHRRRVYVTPKSFLDGVALFADTLADKKRRDGANIDRLKNGCAKLKSTNEQIEGLQTQLATLLPKLVEENLKSEVKAAEISENKIVASQKEAVVERESAYVQSEALKIEALKRENDEELARCKPALEEAERAVSELNKNDITELKTFKQPPEVVELAIRCVFLYLGYGARVEWKQALTVIADIKFLERLKTYDTKNIPQKILTGVGAIIATDAFNPNEMAQKSKVAGGLARWCRAIYMYAEAWKIVKPKEQKQRELAEKLAGAEHEVALKKAELDVVKGEIAKMEADYDALARYV